MIEEFSKMFDDLKSSTIHAYLYGSQLKGLDTSRDVDLLLIVNEDQKNDAIKCVAKIQNQSIYLLHPVFVTVDDYEQNPYFSVLIADGYQMW